MSFLLSVSTERTNWNPEDEVESAVRPPSGHEASLRPQCNGLSEDSGSETSSYSESSRTTAVTSSFTRPACPACLLRPPLA